MSSCVETQPPSSVDWERIWMVLPSAIGTIALLAAAPELRAA